MMKTALKGVLLTCALFSSVAFADLLICVAGQANAKGKLTSMSGNQEKVAFLQDNTVSFYSAEGKKVFAFMKKYNLQKPMPLAVFKLLTLVGSGAYVVEDTSVSANFTFNYNDIDHLVDFKAATDTLTGSLTVKQTVNGNWAGTTMDNFICTTAGIKE